jgi:hypothetical protein
MENLSPSLKFILSIRYALESGRSLNLALKDYLLTARDDFADFLVKWFHHFENGNQLDPSLHLKSATQIVLVQLLEKGLTGIPIHPKLLEIENEVVNKCRLEMSDFTYKLSLRLLIPMLLLQFPSLLILFLGFLSAQISRGLG